MTAPGLTPRDQDRLENLKWEYRLASEPQTRGGIKHDAFDLLLRAGIEVDAAMEMVERGFSRTSFAGRSEG